MKIVKLEQDRVKVILSETDLLNMDIDVQSLTPDSPELSKFLREILEAINIETGFTMDNGQVVVEATTFTNGIILLFSKIKRQRDTNRIKGIKAVKKSESAVFEFVGFDDLIGMLVNASYSSIMEMKLFKYMNSFYITIPTGDVPLVMYEYSLKMNKSGVAESVLSEYGSYLANGEEIAQMVMGIKKMN